MEKDTFSVVTIISLGFLAIMILASVIVAPQTPAGLVWIVILVVWSVILAVINPHEDVKDL